ncbi:MULTISPECIES: Wzz/FepE/Etk N-terminal domain-containing protein [unclassified Shinella]|uniref:exopolysaccharide transport family protein n=1 Tax=unclassified Shinella TaxID=2643062 RepID=UPI00225C6009|nr:MULTISPECIES: Wzz/FepE/Etk N-terminal domain-containing protein [unclassified Shinella]MCO5135970.1 Wzz/FepE/Etk N-terminal domain-containing protein [Shinella sp.]MDC7254395.1 chain-length determining protein [Shinella sp. YE25]CAI0337085.1 Chain-length determining protein [Rhizobiaceae bacterium]CAK7255602.1 Chain-length determining protein [Shinella sp. WSC3-e]
MSGAHSQQDVDIDLGGLFGAIWRNRMRVLLATVACAGIAFAGASLVTPRYKSEARLLIETREPAFTTGTDRAQGREQQPALDELGIASQVQLLRSADLIKQVARNMKLYELEEFDPAAKPSAISDLLVLFGLKKSPLDLEPEERVLKEFNSKLVVYQVERSRVIGIEFSSKDPRLAAEIPNEMAKVYLSLQSGAKLDTNSEATRWLEPEIANLREKVREAEQKVAEYRSQSDLLPTGENSTFAVRQLTDISTELARVRGERANAEARAESVRTVLKTGGAPDTLSDVVGSQMIQRLKESEAQIQGQISDLSTSLLDGHPRLKGLRSQLAGIRGQIKAETQKILSSLENEARTAQLRETQLLQQLNTVKANSARAGEDEVGLKALEREATAQRQLLETYLARYREATSRTDSSSTPADARIISAAVEPTEVAFPKVVPITIVGGLAGFMLSAIAILLAELFSGRALKPVGAAAAVPARREEEAVEDEVEADLPAEEPVIHKTPALHRDPVARLDHGPVRDVRAPAKSLLADIAPDEDEEEQETEAGSPASLLDTADPGEEEAEFSIAAVARYMVENNVSVAISVSPSGDRGSTATVMLARRIAEEHRKTLIIDLTGSACPTRLMAQSAHMPGITDLLVGDAVFGDIIHGDRLSGAHVVPRGNANIKRAMRGIDRLAMVISSLADAYDTVIVECGPADVEGVRRLTRDQETDIILSLPGADEDEIVEMIDAFGAAGYSEVMLMTGEGGEPPRYPGRRAA